MSGIARYEVRKAASGEFYFCLIAGNGEVVSMSELYQRREDAVRGAEDAKRVASEAEVDE